MVLSHFVAVNCHPFHPLDDIRAGLHSLAKAIGVFRQRCGDIIQVRVFWHSDKKAPEDILDDVMSFGFDVTHWPHQSNGQNLNRQIEFALEHKFDTFFRVDADDTVTAQRFIRQAEALESGACDICGAGLRYKPDDGAPFVLLPKAHPGPRDYLENKFLLHPSMAMRLSAIEAAGLRYWTNRIEDKALLLQAYKKGLRIMNLPVVAGGYNVTRASRGKFVQKWLGFKLNLRFLSAAKAFHLMPYACTLFLFHVLLGSHRMRALRHLIQRRKTALLRSTDTATGL